MCAVAVVGCLSCREVVSLKVIFLDIDGVLNTFGQQYGYPMVDPELAKRFNRIVADTDARVVISSSWRGVMLNGHMDRHGFEQMLRSHNVHCTVIGCTGDGEGRGWQIRGWLSGKYDKIESWLVLDDCPDKLMLTMPLVQTNGSVGLSDEDVKRAVEILDGRVG